MSQEVTSGVVIPARAAFRARGILAAVVFAAAVATPAAAQTYDVAAGGLWTGSATWSPNVVNGPAAPAVISITNSAPTADVSLGGTAGSSYSIASITHSGSNAIRFIPGITTSNTGAKTLTVSGDIRTNGAGTLNFSSAANANPLTLNVGGNLLVDSGTLRFGTDGNNSGPGTLALTGSTVVATGATLVAANSFQTYNRTVLNGAFRYDNTNYSTARNTTFTGLSGNGSIAAIDNASVAYTHSLVFNSASDSFTYSGSITQGSNTSFSITKSNAGRQVLSGALTYSGVTAINGGVLQFDSAIPATSRIDILNTTSGSIAVLGLGFANLAINTGTSAGQLVMPNGVNGGFAAYNADRTVTLNSGAVVTWGTNNFMGVNSPNNSLLVLGSDTADAKVTLVNDINFNAGQRAVSVPDGPARYEAELSGALSSGQLNKSGAGILRLTGSGAAGFTISARAGVTVIAGSGTYLGNFEATGGVLGLGNGNLTRGLGAGDGQVRLQNVGAGFAAFDDNRTVNIGAGTNLTWGSTSNFFNNNSGTASRMVLNVSQSQHTLTFANNLDLNGTRTIDVGDGTAAVDASMTGVVSGATSSLVKAGAGTLELTGANTFGNATTVQAGVVRFSTLAAGASAQNLGQGSLVELGVAATSAGEIDYRGSGGTLDKNVTALGSGKNRIRNSGGGTLTLSGTLTKDGTILELASGTFAVTGRIRGATVGTSDLFINNATVTLSNANNDYNGPTYVYGGGTLVLGGSNVIPSTSALILGGTGSDTGTGTINTGTFTNSLASLTTSALGATVAISGSGATIGGLTTTGNLTFGAGTDTLALTLTNPTLGRYTLFTYQGSRSGTFDSVTGNGNYNLVYGAASNSTIDLQLKANQAGTFTMTTGTVSRALVNSTVALSGTVTNTSPANSAALSLGLGSTGQLTVTNLTTGSVNANSSLAVSGSIGAGSTVGSRTWTVVNTDNNAITTTSTATGSISVVNQRTFSSPATINLGRVLIGASPVNSGTVTSTALSGTTASSTLQAYSGSAIDGLSLSGGNVLFNGTTTTAAYMLTGSVSATAGNAIGGTFNLNAQDEFGNTVTNAANVAYTGTAVAQRTFTVSNSGTINLGNVLVNSLLTGSTAISSSGSYATTANASLGAFTGGPSGFSLALASGTNVFDGGSGFQQAGYSLSGSAASAGAIFGSFTSPVTAELGSISSLAVAVTGTAYNPAIASFTAVSATTAWSVNIGEFNQNTGSYTAGFNIYNLYTGDPSLATDLMLDSITPIGSPFGSLSLNLTSGSFGNLAPGLSSNWLASLSSTTTGSFSNQYQLNFVSSKGGQSLGGPQSMTLTVTGVIVVPEPHAIALAGIGMAAAAWARCRRRG